MANWNEDPSVLTSSPVAPPRETVDLDRVPAAWAAPVYFAAYLAYLFAHPESDLEHWLTLVLLPLVLVLAIRWIGPGPPGPW